MIDDIANHLWQSTLYAAVVGLLCLALRKDAASIRYWLWLSASIKFLVPFALLTRLTENFSGNTPLPLAESWTATANLVSEPIATSSNSWSFGPILLACWIAGACFVVGHWIRRTGKLRKLLTSSSSSTSVTHLHGTSVRVIRPDASIEPGIFGLFRPVLLFPKDLENQLTPQELDAVLMHEVCHVRRRDNLTAALHMVVETIFWFFPPIWWIGARLIEERERACDEAVVAAGHDRETYAVGILNTCERYTPTKLRCAAGIFGGELNKRVNHIMGHSTMKPLAARKRLLLALSALLVTAIPLLVGLSNSNIALAQQQSCVPSNLPMPSYPSGFSWETPEQWDPPYDNGLYLPIVKTTPLYPESALNEGLEGFALVQYTVTRLGTAIDIEVLETSSSVFADPTAESVKGYRYLPCVVDGEPADAAEVKTKIIFRLEDTTENPPEGLMDPVDGADTIIVTSG